MAFERRYATGKTTVRDGERVVNRGPKGPQRGDQKGPPSNSGVRSSAVRSDVVFCCQSRRRRSCPPAAFVSIGVRLHPFPDAVATVAASRRRRARRKNSFPPLREREFHQLATAIAPCNQPFRRVHRAPCTDHRVFRCNRGVPNGVPRRFLDVDREREREKWVVAVGQRRRLDYWRADILKCDALGVSRVGEVSSRSRPFRATWRRRRQRTREDAGACERRRR